MGNPTCHSGRGWKKGTFLQPGIHRAWKLLASTPLFKFVPPLIASDCRRIWQSFDWAHAGSRGGDELMNCCTRYLYSTFHFKDVEIFKLLYYKRGPVGMDRENVTQLEWRSDDRGWIWCQSFQRSKVRFSAVWYRFNIYFFKEEIWQKMKRLGG